MSLNLNDSIYIHFKVLILHILYGNEGRNTLPSGRLGNIMNSLYTLCMIDGAINHLFLHIDKM